MHPSEPVSSVFQLIYASSAREGFDLKSLGALLRGSRARNRRRDVTGILLYHEGAFLQVLEGERNAVEALFEKIQIDPRHIGVTSVWHGVVAQREFPEFAMAFRDIMDPALSDLEGRSELLLQRLPQLVQGGASPAQHFIRVFRRVNRIDP